MRDRPINYADSDESLFQQATLASDMGHRYYYLEDKGDLPDTYNVTLDVDLQRLRQILATLPAWSALFFVSSPCLKNLFSIFVFFSPANLFQLAGVTPFAGGRLYFFSNYKDFNN